ncbi:hypothetical protein E3J62_09465 [candidate division TA06 bacterium]|uniref:Uncharacterized protein n=1 Tax=candidate division TA06 bacterium TaxID=2250710 RepID=A0A523UQD7_UNCT6|nr:MAG: hypothetical protein E3J62_09465 [candidate division TA06 bacterium]
MRQNLLKWLLWSVGIVLLVPVSVFPQECFEKGDVIFHVGPPAVWHSGIYIDWNSSLDPNSRSSHRVAECITEGIDSAVVRGFDAFFSAGAFQGVRTLHLSAHERTLIINTAIEYATRDQAVYSVWWYKHPNFDPPHFRCDGFVEYCYEIGMNDPDGGIVPNDTRATLWPRLQWNRMFPRDNARLDTVCILEPSADDTVSDTIAVTVYLSDGDSGSGVAKVELWADDDSLDRLEKTVCGHGDSPPTH